MMVLFLWFLILLLLFLCTFLFVKPIVSSSLSPRQETTLLFTNARDEPNILEWVVHHLHLGFSHIFLTDHRSLLPLSTVLAKLPPSRLTIVREEGDIRKEDLIEKAFVWAKTRTYDWMIYLDADEFLYLAHDDTVSEFLRHYRSYDQVGINWLCFGSSGIDRMISGTLLERFTTSAQGLDRHIKSFLHVRRVAKQQIHTYNAHVYLLREMRHSIAACDRKRLHKESPFFYPTQQSVDSIPVFIAHYEIQSYDRYLFRKIKRPSDDTGTYQKQKSKTEIHNMYNDVECRLMVDKYNTRNLDSIQKYWVDGDHMYRPLTS